MCHAKRSLIGVLFIVFFFWGWVDYQRPNAGWVFTYLEDYAYPASMVGVKDPPWGFWYW